MFVIAQRLKVLKKSWQALEVAPHSLAALGMPGKDSRFVEDIIDWLAYMATKLADAPVESMTMVERSCDEQLKHLEAFFSEQRTENPSIRMLGFVALLLQMKSLLRGALEQSGESRNDQHQRQKFA